MACDHKFSAKSLGRDAFKTQGECLWKLQRPSIKFCIEPIWPANVALIEVRTTIRESGN